MWQVLWRSACRVESEQLVHSDITSLVLLSGADLSILGSCGVKLCKERYHRSGYRSFQPILMCYMFWFFSQGMCVGILG